MGKTLSKTNCCVVEQVSSSLSISAEAEKLSFAKDDEPILQLEGGSIETSIPTVSLKFVSNYIQNSSEMQEWPAMLSLTCEEQDVDLRGGIDLVCLLETSSVTRSKERMLKNSVEFLMSRLTGQDRLSLVSFSDSGRRLSPLLSMTYTGKVRINLQLQSLSYSGGVNLIEGLLTGFSVLSNRRLINRQTFLIVFASGQDSQLETIKERLSLMFPDFLTQEIHLWVFGLSPSKVLTFLSESCSGCCFFPDNEKEWFKSLAFATGIIESLVVSQVTAEIKASQNVQIPKVYSETGENKFSMPDGIAGRSSCVIFLIRVLPGNLQNLQEIALAQVSFKLNNVLHSVQQSLTVPFIDRLELINEIEVDEEVLKAFYRCKAADVLYEAAELAVSDHHAAKQLLFKACAELEESCIRDNDLITQLVGDLKNSLNSVSAGFEFNAKTRCLARNHWLKHSSEVEDYQNKSTSVNRFRLKTLFNIV